jgi:Tol biopolymer transport system component
LLLLAGCAPQKGISEKLTVTNDTQPAELSLKDGTAVYAPPGSLPKGATVTIRKVEQAKAPALTEGFTGAEAIYEIQVDKPLQKPLTLRFPVPRVGDEGVLQLSCHRDGRWQPVPFTVEDSFAIVQTDALSFWGWLDTTVDWVDKQLMRYANPDTYIEWFRGVTGLDEYMEIPLEGISDGMSYDDSEAKGLISASACIVEGNKVRLRVRNETKFYLQLSFEGPAPVEPRQGAYLGWDVVHLSINPVLGVPKADDLLRELAPKDVLLLPEGTAEFLTDYVPGKRLEISARFSNAAGAFSIFDPAFGLVPIVDSEMVAAVRDVLGEGSRFVKVLPDLEKGWREHALELLDVVEAASRAGVLAGEKAFESLAHMLILPFAVQYREEYMEGRAIDLLGKGGDAKAGGTISITYLGEEVDRTPPTTPTNLRVTTASPTRIDLSWDPSTDNVGVAGYKVYRDGSFLTSVIATSYSDTGLSPSTRYCYRVSAYDAAGNESAKSNEACATTPSTESASAHKVLFCTGRYDHVLYIVNPDGTNLTKLGERVQHYSWSPTADKVEYELIPGTGKSKHAFTVNPDGTENKEVDLGAAEILDCKWSPDGERLLYWVGTPDGKICITNSDGTARTDLDEGSQPTWSPDGEKVAYINSYGNLCVINRDGTDKIRLAPEVSTHYSPQWGADGKRIAFIRTGRVYVIAPDGLDEIALGTDEYHVSGEPLWSPDGKALAYINTVCEETSCDYDALNVAYFDKEGGVTKDIALVKGSSCADLEFGEKLSWSPDSKKLLYELYGFVEDPGYHILDIENGTDVYLGVAERARSRSPNRSYIGKPIWSPRGDKLAYWDYDTHSFFIINSDGTGRINVGEGDPGEPRWSPDEEKVAYVYTEKFGAEVLGQHINIINADGTGQIAVNGQGPVWSADGAKIAYVREGTIYTCNADGTNETMLGKGLDPVWSP